MKPLHSVYRDKVYTDMFTDIGTPALLNKTLYLKRLQILFFFWRILAKILICLLGWMADLTHVTTSFYCRWVPKVPVWASHFKIDVSIISLVLLASILPLFMRSCTLVGLGFRWFGESSDCKPLCEKWSKCGEADCRKSKARLHRWPNHDISCCPFSQ